MAIVVRPEHEELIEQAIRTGHYRNSDEVIARALEILRSEDEWLEENHAAIGTKIERAFDQFERGDYFSAEESRSDMERRKADWLRKYSG